MVSIQDMPIGWGKERGGALQSFNKLVGEPHSSLLSPVPIRTAGVIHRQTCPSLEKRHFTICHRVVKKPEAMSFLIRAVVVASVLAIVQAAQIDFDEVEPFPETKPTTDEYAVGLKFKPQIYVPDFSCYTYPAVDADGNTSGGSPFSFLRSKCQGSEYGSQVYGRTAVYKDTWAIMYAWYFPRTGVLRHNWEHIIVWLDGSPKNATFSALSTPRSFGFYRTYAPPSSNKFDGDSIKVRYMNVNGARYLKPTQKIGAFQGLVMWEDLTDKARAALETSAFGIAKVPFIDGKFLSNLREAYPW